MAVHTKIRTFIDFVIMPCCTTASAYGACILTLSYVSYYLLLFFLFPAIDCSANGGEESADCDGKENNLSYSAVADWSIDFFVSTICALLSLHVYFNLSTERIAFLAFLDFTTGYAFKGFNSLYFRRFTTASEDMSDDDAPSTEAYYILSFIYYIFLTMGVLTIGFIVNRLWLTMHHILEIEQSRLRRFPCICDVVIPVRYLRRDLDGLFHLRSHRRE